MSIKVLLADGDDVMRPVIAKVLWEEPAVELIGEAITFAETLQMTAALKPDVLLLELHFDDDREYPAEVVKAQVLLNAKCVLAISLWNDKEAKSLLPAIKQFCPKVIVLETTKHSMKEFNQSSTLALRVRPEAA
jgi:DNA-binding NarL/FixJ family response regulator